MPISDNISNLYIQLGIAGATLLILLIFVVLLFRLVSKININENGSQNSQIDKLCNKIDGLISSNGEYTQKLNEVIISNDKDQKETLNLLNRLLELSIDAQKRIVKIDDRTINCIGSSKEGE